VAIQGVGKVGTELARLLIAAGAQVLVSDIDEGAARRIAADTGGSWLEADEVLGAECDILAPCALGGIINDVTIPRLRCAAIVGSANNQLAGPWQGSVLAERGILYAPDFVVNAGGIINISVEFEESGYDSAVAEHRVDAIEGRLSSIFTQAERRGLTPARVATDDAVKRISRARSGTVDRMTESASAGPIG
jgi:leucine dehydrogenase